jgi:hypothetical protein
MVETESGEKLSDQIRLKRAPNAAFRELDGKAFVVGSASTRLVMLNETGTAVWRYLERAMTLPQLAQRLAAEFQVDPDSALRDCEGFLEVMLERELVLLDSDGHRATTGAGQDGGD